MRGLHGLATIERCPSARGPVSARPWNIANTPSRAVIKAMKSAIPVPHRISDTENEDGDHDARQRNRDSFSTNLIFSELLSAPQKTSIRQPQATVDFRFCVTCELWCE